MGREALYRAFRADEGTGPETSLTDHLPKIFGKDSMADLVSAFYPSWGPDTYQRLKKVPPLVFKLASEGDQVCQDILIHMGSVLGEMTRGVIREVGMENMDFHIVLGGSLFYGENPLFIDAFTLAVHRAAPKATIRLARLAPVVGAYLYGLDALGIETDKAIIENLRKSLGLE
jgi:N-acetylglucosamine kinase-like BadF-type ATPase